MDGVVYLVVFISCVFISYRKENVTFFELEMNMKTFPFENNLSIYGKCISIIEFMWTTSMSVDFSIYTKREM